MTFEELWELQRSALWTSCTIRPNLTFKSEIGKWDDDDGALVGYGKIVEAGKLLPPDMYGVLVEAVESLCARGCLMSMMPSEEYDPLYEQYKGQTITH